MPISINEFRNKTELELDMRSSRVGDWTMSFLNDNKDKAFTLQEIADAMPLDVKKKIKHVKSAVYASLVKLIAKGFIEKKGSFYARKNGGGAR